MRLKKNLLSNIFSSAVKTRNSPFECLSIKICRAKNHSLLILISLLRLKCKQKNSNKFKKSIIFLADTFGITSFLIKVIFSRSFKIFSDSRVSEKLFFLSVEKFLKQTPALVVLNRAPKQTNRGNSRCMTTTKLLHKLLKQLQYHTFSNQYHISIQLLSVTTSSRPSGDKGEFAEDAGWL